MKAPWETKNWTTIWFNNPTTEYVSEGNEIGNVIDSYTPMLNAVLVTIAKKQKQVSTNWWVDKEWWSSH